MIDRIADFAHSAALIDHMRRIQADAAKFEERLVSGQRESDYAGLGHAAGVLERMKFAISRAEAHIAAGARAENLYARQTAEIGMARDAVLALRDRVFQTLAAGEVLGLGSAAGHGRDIAVAALSAEHEGRALFAVEGAPVFAVGERDRLPAGLDLSAVQALITQSADDIAAIPDGPLDTAGIAVLESALQRLDAAAEQLNVADATVGQRYNAAETARNHAAQRRDAFEFAIEELNGVNPAEAITRLSQAQNALQASYTVLARLQAMNLAQFL